LPCTAYPCPGQTPVLDGRGSVARAITISSANNIKLRWLTIQNFQIDGIKVSGSSNITIDSNTITNINSNDWNQAAVNITGSFVNGKVTHNYIKSTGYSGIACWFVGDNYSGMAIEYNRILDTVKSVPDGGAIYCMDRGQTRVAASIANNIIGDFGNTDPVVARADGKWNETAGIYLDDQMSNITVKNNIVYGKGHFPVLNHIGDQNKYQNNIFDISDAMVLGSYAQTTGSGNTFTCNIIYSSRNSPSNLWDTYESNTSLFNVSNNNYWKTSGQLSNNGSITDSSPVRIDPKFVNPTGRDYRFQAGSPLSCFTPIDVSTVGPLPNGGTVSTPTSGTPTLTLTAFPTTVSLGTPSTITWSSTNVSSCTGSGAWSGAVWNHQALR
jgi:hypothetical protein